MLKVAEGSSGGGGAAAEEGAQTLTTPSILLLPDDGRSFLRLLDVEASGPRRHSWIW